MLFGVLKPSATPANATKVLYLDQQGPPATRPPCLGLNYTVNNISEVDRLTDTLSSSRVADIAFDIGHFCFFHRLHLELQVAFLFDIVTVLEMYPRGEHTWTHRRSKDELFHSFMSRETFSPCLRIWGDME